MKRKLFISLTIFFTMILSACGQTTSKNETKELSLQEVFDKSMNASNKELKSFSADMKMKQQMNSSMLNEEMNMSMDMKMDYIADPISWYQVLQMSIEDTGESLNMESYLTKDGYYLFDEMSGQWMKLPSEMANQMTQLPENQSNPIDQIEQLKPFLKEFSMEQEGDHYVLKMDGSGDKFSELITDMILGSLGTDGAQEAKDLFSQLSIEKLSYTIHINKDTFFPTYISMVMESNFTIDGESIFMHQELEGTYSNYNNIKSIEIPEEVLNSATEGF